MSFANKVALVTGAGSGIGEATAKELARLGARIILADISEEGARRVADEIRAAGGEAAPFRADSASAGDNEAAVAFALRTYGKLNYAVNNAGIGGNAAPTGETDLADWNRVIDINLNGVLYAMRYQIPAMLEAGAGECAIVNMASIHGAVAAPGNSAYTAAKHGVVGLTKNAAAEYGPQGLRINCVGPAYIDTPLLKNLDPETLGQLAGMHPIGRLGTPSEVSALTCFLLSEQASFITGSYHLVDGGYTAR